jgi:hypothetical protein
MTTNNAKNSLSWIFSQKTFQTKRKSYFAYPGSILLLFFQNLSNRWIDSKYIPYFEFYRKKFFLLAFFFPKRGSISTFTQNLFIEQNLLNKIYLFDSFLFYFRIPRPFITLITNRQKKISFISNFGHLSKNLHQCAYQLSTLLLV